MYSRAHSQQAATFKYSTIFHGNSLKWFFPYEYVFQFWNFSPTWKDWYSTCSSYLDDNILFLSKSLFIVSTGGNLPKPTSLSSVAFSFYLLRFIRCSMIMTACLIDLLAWCMVFFIIITVTKYFYPFLKSLHINESDKSIVQQWIVHNRVIFLRLEWIPKTQLPDFQYVMHLVGWLGLLFKKNWGN